MEIKKIQTTGHIISIEDKFIEYSRVPSGLIPGFDGIVFYFRTTSGVVTNEEHDKLVKLVAESLISQNESNHSSWEITKSDTFSRTQLYEVTVMSFRIRESY